MTEFVGAIDQGTTSTRFMVFDHDGREVVRHQLEHQQILPEAGWVEHDPIEIWERTDTVVRVALNRAGLGPGDLAALGVTNQRETTIVWDRRTGRPLYNAIVWQDTRTDRIAAALERDGRGDLVRSRAGLPPATYFSGGKIQWILDNVDGVRTAAERGDALFGTTDSWVIWHLTGGVDGGVHVTDPTNASRTMLMDLATLDWDDELLALFGIPRSMLPAIRPSSSPDPYGVTRPTGPFGGTVAVCGDLGDQHAATVGQVCFSPGQAKNTYGTGNFMLLNTGTDIVRSAAGLLTTVAYQFGDQSPVYALEGSIAVTGSAVQWLRDQLGIISNAADVEALARQVPDAGGVYFVRRSPVCSRRTGAPTPAAPSSGSPASTRGPPRPGHAGGDLLSDPRRGRRDGAGFRGGHRRAQGRRRDHGQRAVHADPGRRARRAGEPPGRRRDDGARRGVRRRPRRRLLVGHRRPACELARGATVGAAVDAPTSATPVTPAGARRSSARWTGWTSDERASLRASENQARSSRHWRTSAGSCASQRVTVRQ